MIDLSEKSTYIDLICSLVQNPREQIVISAENDEEWEDLWFIVFGESTPPGSKYVTRGIPGDTPAVWIRSSKTGGDIDSYEYCRTLWYRENGIYRKSAFYTFSEVFGPAYGSMTADIDEMF